MTQGLGGRPVENAKHTAVAHMESDTCGCLNAPNTRPTSSNWDTHTTNTHIQTQTQQTTQTKGLTEKRHKVLQ